jgi:hypothetical protein
MTSALAILDQARTLGIHVSTNGPKLRLRIPDALAEKDWESIRGGLVEHKAAVLALLSDPPRPVPSNWAELSSKRWANQLADPTPDIDIIRPDRARMLAAVEALQGQRGDADETGLEDHPRWCDRPDYQTKPRDDMDSGPGNDQTSTSNHDESRA